MKGRPFALLHVNSDSDTQEFRKAIGDKPVASRIWWDGGDSGPVAKQWSVTSWPAVFVLDHEGVIRHRDLRDRALDEVVDAMVKQANTDGSR